MIQDYLKKLSFWGKFVGWTLFISGILTGLIGLIGFIVGAIPGIITAFMGWKLIKASENAEKLSHETDNEVALSALLSNYLSFFKTQGILLIVTFVVYGGIFLLMMIGTFAGLSEIMSTSY